MSSDAMNWEKFRIDTVHKAVDCRIKCAQAEADIAMKYVEILEKRIKVEEDINLRKLHQDVRKLFEKRRHRAARELQIAKLAYEGVRTALLDVMKLKAPLSLTSVTTTYAWTAFYLLLNTLSPADSFSILEEKITPDERDRDNYYHPGYRTSPKTNVIDDVETVGDLFYYLRKFNLAPKSGRKSMQRMYAVLEAIWQSMEEEEPILKEDLEQKKQELEKLGSADWATIDIKLS